MRLNVPFPVLFVSTMLTLRVGRNLPVVQVWIAFDLSENKVY